MSPALAVTCLAAFLVAAPAFAQISREKALAAIYPGAEVRMDTIFLTGEQKQKASSLAGIEVSTNLIARYTAVRDAKVVGHAYVDTHTVRTKNESLLIALDESGRIRRIEVTAFLEPPEFQAPRAWYDQYNGRSLTEDLRLHRAIRPIAGASLTARATADATRRVLALHQVLQSEKKDKE